jgi:hypothetical protein
MRNGEMQQSSWFNFTDRHTHSGIDGVFTDFAGDDIARAQATIRATFDGLN